MAREIKIGLSILVAIVLTYLIIAYGKNAQIFSDNQLNYEIHFPNVNGLLEGDPVNVLGYKSGRVESIRPSGDHVKVFILLDKEIPMQSDASAEIQVKELLGGKQIELKPGVSGQAFPVNGILKGGSSMDISNFFSQVGEISGEIDLDGLNQSLKNLQTITQNLADYTEAITPQMLTTTLGRLEETTIIINRLLKQTEEKDFLESVDTMLNQANHLAKTADQSLKQVNRLVGKAESTLIPRTDTLFTEVSEVIGHTDQLISKLDELMLQLKNENTLAGKLLYDEEFVTELDELIDNVDKTITHVRTGKIHVAMGLSHKPRKFKDVQEEHPETEKK